MTKIKGRNIIKLSNIKIDTVGDMIKKICIGLLVKPYCIYISNWKINRNISRYFQFDANQMTRQCGFGFFINNEVRVIYLSNLGILSSLNKIFYGGAIGQGIHGN